jgi:hypothetical protein
MRRAAGAFVILGVSLLGATACSSSTKSASDASATSTTQSTPVAVSELRAVLDDTGLHLPPGRLHAAKYRVSFTDERSHPPRGRHVTLRLRPSGPDITILEVPAGQTRVATIVQNVVAYVAIDGKDARVPVENQLDIVATKEYPTPAT